MFMIEVATVRRRDMFAPTASVHGAPGTTGFTPASTNARFVTPSKSGGGATAGHVRAPSHAPQESCQHVCTHQARHRGFQQSHVHTMPTCTVHARVSRGGGSSTSEIPGLLGSSKCAQRQRMASWRPTAHQWPASTRHQVGVCAACKWRVCRSVWRVCRCRRRTSRTHTNREATPGTKGAARANRTTQLHDKARHPPP
jgi:hypothetical protein